MADEQTQLEFTDEAYSEQADYIAQHTGLTTREAEAYMRKMTQSETTPDNKIANQMGISKSTYSQHLSEAQQKLEGNDSLLRELTRLFHTTDLGGAEGIYRQVTGTTTTENAYVLITETEFKKDGSRFPERYRAHIVYRDKTPDIHVEDQPESTVYYQNWSLFTVSANSKTDFSNGVVAYVMNISSLNYQDVVDVVGLLEGLGFPDDTNTVENALQDAYTELHQNGSIPL